MLAALRHDLTGTVQLLKVVSLKFTWAVYPFHLSFAFANSFPLNQQYLFHSQQWKYVGENL